MRDTLVEAGAGVFDRIDFDGPGDPTAGRVRWDPAKSLWWSSMFAGWLTFGALYFSWSAVGVFLLLSALTLSLGHSLGMHRLLIHGAFKVPKWLERVMISLGTLVGLGGPFTMMRNHDMRDWAQRSAECHPFLSHQSSFKQDFWWQLHCKLDLDEPPEFTFPRVLAEDAFYSVLQRLSMATQLPLAVLLFALGGWGWVAWGVCGRVCVSIFGHWLVGYFAHNQGDRVWHLEGASTQGYNLARLGLITFGECWHNNHHAFPGSARLGLSVKQFDPGWQILRLLERLGLAWDIQTPETLPFRSNLVDLRR